MDPLAYLFSLEQFGIKFGLDNINAIVARLGHPERTFRSVHIAGTNGKGSVTAMVAAALQSAGHRVARYTSPHLVELNERFVVDNRPVSTGDMIAALEHVRDTIEALRAAGTLDVQPTFFEVTTALAFELFSRARVEIAVVEVGLGGRLDATNVITPEAAAITSIAFDHQLYLGSTLRDIAVEKAGIIKPGVPVVLGDMDRTAQDAIEDIARARNAPVVHATAADLGARTVGLPGEHQRANAAVALHLLRLLASRGVVLPDSAIDRGLAHAEWPGRIDLRRLADGRELLLDAAHNPAGAAALAQYLRAQQGPRLPLVFAAMRDKDVAAMFDVLLPAVANVTFTRAANPRSADPSDLARLAHSASPSIPIAIEPDLRSALDAAWRSSPRILVAGSIFLLGDVMRQLPVLPAEHSNK